MKRPPMIVQLKLSNCEEGHRKGFYLWVPLFIVVPVVFVLLLTMLIIALPFIFLYTLLAWDYRLWRWITFGAKAFFNTAHELTGSKLEVEDDKKYINIDVH